MQQNKLIIAIDGPGAAGKSTVAKKYKNVIDPSKWVQAS